jgi:hypothetical protein
LAAIIDDDESSSLASPSVKVMVGDGLSKAAAALSSSPAAAESFCDAIK